MSKKHRKRDLYAEKNLLLINKTHIIILLNKIKKQENDKKQIQK